MECRIPVAFSICIDLYMQKTISCFHIINKCGSINAYMQFSIRLSLRFVEKIQWYSFALFCFMFHVVRTARAYTHTFTFHSLRFILS